MKALQIYTVLVALVLMVGEGYRSWGAGRPVITWLDDMILGALMIAAAVAMGRETPARRAFLTGVWGIAIGAVFVSFMSKIVDPASTIAGNLQLSVLIWALAIIFVGTIAGFAASLVIPFKQQA
ncbi:MAG: hypothetical protein AB7H66_15485 [Hyphomonadaceae bacterium]